MAAHARLKNEFTEDEKYHNLMRGLIYILQKKTNTETNSMNEKYLQEVPQSKITVILWHQEKEQKNGTTECGHTNRRPARCPSHSFPNELQHDKTNKMACAPSEDSDQPGHSPSLINVFTVSMKKHLVLSYPLSAQ